MIMEIPELDSVQLFGSENTLHIAHRHFYKTDRSAGPSLPNNLKPTNDRVKSLSVKEFKPNHRWGKLSPHLVIQPDWSWESSLPGCITNRQWFWFLDPKFYFNMFKLSLHVCLHSPSCISLHYPLHLSHVSLPYPLPKWIYCSKLKPRKMRVTVFILLKAGKFIRAVLCTDRSIQYYILLLTNEDIIGFITDRS